MLFNDVFFKKNKKKLLKKLVFLLIIIIVIGISFGIGANNNLLQKIPAQVHSTLLALNFTQEKAKTALTQVFSNHQDSTQSQEIAITNSTCNEQDSINLAKNCTYVIRTDVGHGSGFAIDEFFIVTNKHVIEDASSIATYINQEKLELELWHFSKTSDLAVLRSSQPLPFCTWANSDQILLAETLYAVGWPNTPDGESSITKGIFSRLVHTDEGVIFIQTDTAINPGNSGGPLVNSCGIVGVNTAKISWSEDDVPAEGFSFAITSNYAQQIIAQLIQAGFVHALPIQDAGQVDYNFTQDQPAVPQPGSTKYYFTPESRASWLQAETVTNELHNYWQNQVGELDQSKLAELGDLIARMRAVIEVVLPKIKANQSLSAAENELLSAWKNMYQKVLKLEGELHNRDYSTGYAHLTCAGNSCALVGGRGIDQCKTAQDCAPKYHYSCANMTCTVVEGEGENECTSHDDCYHYLCQGEQCVKVDGNGTDQCYFDWQCQP